jgi:Ca2+-binding EF-hand superfamily protein
MKLANLEKELEAQRQVLCKLPTFNPYRSFMLLSKGKNAITSHDIKEYLELTYIPAFPKQLDFKAFLNIILPINNDIRTETTKLNIEAPGVISADVETHIKKLLTLELQFRNIFHACTAKLKQDLTSPEPVSEIATYRATPKLKGTSSTKTLIRSYEKKHSTSVRMSNTFSETKLQHNTEKHLLASYSTELYSKNTIKTALTQQLNLEQLLEESKKSLSLDNEFDIQHCFAMLSDCSKEYITLTDLIKKLKEMGVYHTKNEIVLFLRRYGEHGKMDMEHFYKAFTPYSEEYKCPRSAPYISVGRYSSCFISTFSIALDVERKLELLRVDMRNMSLYSAYKEICGHMNCISPFALSNFLDADASILFDKYDKNKDSVITYMEFIEELCPKAPFLINANV